MEREAGDGSSLDRVAVEEGEEVDLCWICHQPENADKGRLLKQHCQCKCLLAHDACIAHWQLRNAGGIEELKCRFCGVFLPDWKAATLMEGKRRVTQTVTLCVQVNGRSKYMKVKVGGQEKIAEFRNKIKKAFGLSDTASLDIDFTVENPFTGETITLNGMNTYCAAIHCGALTDKTDKKKETETERERDRERGEHSQLLNQSKEEEEEEEVTDPETETDLEVRCTDRYERMQERRRARLLLQAERREMDLEQSLDEVLESVQIEPEAAPAMEDDGDSRRRVSYGGSDPFTSVPSSSSSASASGLLCGLLCSGRNKRRRRERA